MKKLSALIAVLFASASLSVFAQATAPGTPPGKIAPDAVKSTPNKMDSKAAAAPKADAAPKAAADTSAPVEKAKKPAKKKAKKAAKPASDAPKADAPKKDDAKK